MNLEQRIIQLAYYSKLRKRNITCSPFERRTRQAVPTLPQDLLKVLRLRWAGY